MSLPDPVFISPLLGADDAWTAYFVELAPEASNHDALVRLCNSPSLEGFDARHPWFVPALGTPSDASKLGERAIPVFPAAPAPQDAETLSQLEAGLRRAARKVASIAVPDSKLPGSGSWDYLLISNSHARSLPPFTLIGLASRTTPVIVDVHTHNDREWLLNNASTFSTGEFLQTRASVSGKADITRVNLLKLLTLIIEDADTAALDAIFKEEQKLSYSLLRLVNSAAMSPRSPITSFSQGINLLGRRQLQRWLQLLVYSDPNNGQHPNPLLQKAATRGRVMELIARQLDSTKEIENVGDIAFMIGTFSLLDVLLNMSMPEVLRQLPLPEISQKALGEHSGPLGELLAAIIAADRRELKTAAQRIKTIGVSADDFLDAQLEALSWAARIRPAA